MGYIKKVLFMCTVCGNIDRMERKWDDNGFTYADCPKCENRMKRYHPNRTKGKRYAR